MNFYFLTHSEIKVVVYNLNKRIKVHALTAYLLSLFPF